jgi:recombination protein RecT
MDPTMPVVKYEPRAPVASHGTLRALLTQSRDRIAEVAPRHVSADRLLKLALVAATRNPQILTCTQESVLLALMQAAELGVDISGTRGEAWLVPYKQQCQLQIGYIGLARLAYQSGEVRRIEAEVVYGGDDFEYVKGTAPTVRLSPALGGRGEPVGAYALVELTSGGILADWMSRSEIEAIRRRSRSGGSGPWSTDWGEMAKKTVWRRLSKYVPLSSERYVRAQELADAEYELPSRHEPSERAAELNVRLGLQEPAGNGVGGPEIAGEDTAETFEPDETLFN